MSVNKLRSIVIDGKEHVFREPIEIIYELVDSFNKKGNCIGHDYYLDCKKLHVYAFGGTEEEAFRELSKEIMIQYVHYKQTPWNKVTGLAKQLKYVYENLFC